MKAGSEQNKRWISAECALKGKGTGEGGRLRVRLRLRKGYCKARGALYLQHSLRQWRKWVTVKQLTDKRPSEE